ncbi:hypothetical protein ACI1TW_09945 [Lactococcus garvieae]|uniref:hypothetical protein n=1 Tax=Lactococcus garvieae TaxID=1363 RepID=UPI00385337A2
MMFGWGKNNFRFELSEVNNIHDDDIQDISDLVNFMGNENLDLQHRGETGSVVITKLKEDKHGDQIIYSEKIELPIDCEPEEFEKILSKFYSKKPLAFETITVEKKSYNFIPEKTSKQEESGYAAVPELNFDDEEIPEEVTNTSEVEPQQENFSSAEAEEDSISEKDKKIKEQEEEIARLRAMAKATSEPREELIQKAVITEDIENKELSPEDKASLKDDIVATKNIRRSSSEEVIIQSTEQLDDLYGKGKAQKIFKDQQDVTLEAIELMNQAKRGMQPRDAIEYQVAVEYEAEKKRKLKEAEEQALIKQQSEISAAQLVFEEKQKEIIQKAEIELHKVKKTIDQDFEKRKMDEVNSRMDKQKAYIKNFVADLATQMNRYIESGKDINS